MDTRANVQSTESIEAVRAALVLFVDQISDALTILDLEMRRTLEWLEHDRPRFWKTQTRLAFDQVNEAQAALHRCLMFPINDERPSCSEERAALKKAQARLVYCQAKSERVRSWARTLQHELFEYQGRISQLVRLVEVEAPQSIGVLNNILRRLEEYQSIRVGATAGAYNDVALAEELFPAETPADASQPATDESTDESADEEQSGNPAPAEVRPNTEE